MRDIITLTDKQKQAIFAAYQEAYQCQTVDPDNVEKIYLKMSQYGGGLNVATIERPIDYDTLINKSVCVRSKTKMCPPFFVNGVWYSGVLKTVVVSKQGIAFSLWNDIEGYQWEECLPFDPELVGR